MDNWWQFGQHRGHLGRKLALYQIACPFCSVEGNYRLAHHAEKKQPNGTKVLNFDTYECGNCKGYVLIFWSASDEGYGEGLHDYYALPWHKKLTKHPEHWPADIGRYWLQAHRSLNDENWDAAVVMTRSAMQLALRAHDAKGKNLKEEIADLAGKGILPPLMRDWSDNIRELGNDSAHPKPGQAPTKPADAKDITEFLDYLLKYLYDLPHEIEDYRKRRS